MVSLIAAACSGNEVTPVAPVVKVARVAVTASFQVIEAGAMMNVTATLTDTNGAPVLDRDVTWTSNNPAVATVTPTGQRAAKVTGVAPGSVTISAAVDGVTGSVALGTVPSTVSQFTPQQAFFYSENDGIFAIPNLPGATSSYATGISNAGFVVGTDVVGGKEHAFLWRADMELRDLGILPGALASFATAVNDSAEVVGYSSVPLRPGSSRSNETHPFRWTKSGGMVELSLPVNASYGEATGVNNAGEISGWVVYVTSTGQSARPVRWRPDGTVEALAIPSGDVDGVASAINDDGDIVGYGDDGYYYFAAVHALVWHRGGGVTIVDACGQECIVDGHSISSNGRVAGIRLDHAFVWTQAGGVVDFPSLPGASYSEARGVNDTGQLAINNFYPAGPRASIAFGPGKFQDLGIVRGKSYTTAAAINNAGAIVGFAQ